MVFIQILILISILFFLGIVFYETIKFIVVKKFSTIIDAKNNTVVAEKVLISDLANTKYEIDIVTGNANPEFYGREEIVNNLRKIAEENKIINVYSGKPKVEKDQNTNPLVALSEDYPRVNFYQIDTNYLQPHFRIIDNRDVFIERNHISGSDNRYYCYFRNDRFLARKYKEKINSFSKNLIAIS